MQINEQPKTTHLGFGMEIELLEEPPDRTAARVKADSTPRTAHLMRWS